MGKHKYIETPEKMWELFIAYKLFCKNNPILVEDYVGKDAERVERQRVRALTMEGFECFVMDNTEITYPDLTNYFDGKLESFSNFIPICTRIKREIRTNQIELGLANAINQSITQRLNGLKEQTEQEVTINKPVIIDWSNGTDSTTSNT